jgi:hypothetical protein
VEVYRTDGLLSVCDADASTSPSSVTIELSNAERANLLVVPLLSPIRTGANAQPHQNINLNLSSKMANPFAHGNRSRGPAINLIAGFVNLWGICSWESITWPVRSKMANPFPQIIQDFPTAAIRE